jgi:hypothetical protein
MFVCIQFSYEYDYVRDYNDPSVDNIYGPFPTLEAAEEFRSKHKYPEDCDCFLLQSPKKVLDNDP